ncbi:MAG TPA: glycerophosphodiester phosphodiesterase family protein [Verrucomicrobiae bacterium]|nr:glycerophosphodiester phosphodiesterase family protein [Verrucomicrobiae bacterium]
MHELNHAPEERALAAGLLTSGFPLVIAHRGYSKRAPENTLAAFELAKRARADLVELDARRTADGQLLAIHDPLLDRTTDVVRKWGKKRCRVQAHTAESIRHLDAGSWFGHHFAGTRIPLVSEALRSLEDSRSLALVERKSGSAGDYVSLFERMGISSRVVLQAFDWHFLHQAHRLQPQLLLGALGPPAILPNGRKRFGVSRRLTIPWLDRARAAGAKVVVWNRRVSRRAVQCAHEKGLRVWVYTIDDVRLAKKLVAAGVDGIITNDPGGLYQAFRGS